MNITLGLLTRPPRRRQRIFHLVVAALLAFVFQLSISGPAMVQAQEEDHGRKVSVSAYMRLSRLCREEERKFCRVVQGYGLDECLMRHVYQLSEECRDALDSYGEGEQADIAYDNVLSEMEQTHVEVAIQRSWQKKASVVLAAFLATLLGLIVLSKLPLGLCHNSFYDLLKLAGLVVIADRVLGRDYLLYFHYLGIADGFGIGLIWFFIATAICVGIFYSAQFFIKGIDFESGMYSALFGWLVCDFIRCGIFYTLPWEKWILAPVNGA